ncbi:MAG: tol-pal system-associated acyl-CoA thioesterase [Gammaproteobacteria bacterium]|nr:tol-pal system-associated acyl-CoA thioesterase [Gammaproteobacteria bacterium]
MNARDEFVFPVRVYYEDTDCAGIVYYANYLRFLERARTEWLRALGFAQDLLIEQGVAFAVTRVELDYKKAARFNELLHALCQVEQVGRASMEFVQSVVNAADPSIVYVSGRVKVACISMDAIKVRPIPEALRGLLVNESSEPVTQ